MKIFIVFAVLVFIVTCAKVDPLHGLSEEKAFQNLISKYNKVYASEKEYDHRFNVFKDNLKIIEDLNAKDPEAIYGINEFTDLSPEEFTDSYRMKNFSALKMELEVNGQIDLLPTAPALTGNFSALPTAYDWVGKGCVTAIYQQGSCGSCWTFGTAENLESQACIKGGGKRNFSMQQILDCCTGSCKGGYPSNALAYVKTYGIMGYSSYPYTGAKGNCRYSAASVAQKITSYGYIDRNKNENNIRNWVYSSGAPLACVDSKTWQYYQGGLVTSNCGVNIDHVVQIVGWTTMNGKLAWKVRNSWGTGWGASGYMYIAIGGNLCAIAQEVMSAT